MVTEMKSVFIISLPRSGSTLLQRILAISPEISSVSEPWLLLPFAGLSEYGNLMTYSEYSFRVAHSAYTEFVNSLPNGDNDYYLSLSRFIDDIYGKASKDNSQYFLDKTPRYYLIVDFIKKVFPDSKIIFLVRNPLDVFSSMMEAWWKNRLWINHQQIDLFRGPQCIHEAIHKYKDSSICVSYEDLVTGSEDTIRDICSFLDIEFNMDMLSGVGEKDFGGTMGDKLGIRKYKEVSRESLGRWTAVFTNPIRKNYIKKYLDFLGPEVLSTFGVDAARLKGEIKLIKSSYKYMLDDSIGIVLSALSRKLCLKLVKSQISNSNCPLID